MKQGQTQSPAHGTRLARYLVALWAVFSLAVLQGCAPTTHLRVLMRMPESQAAHFKQGVLAPFEKKHRCRVTLATYASVENLEDKLRLLPDSLQPDIVEVPHEMALPLSKAGLIRPMEGRADARALAGMRRDFFFAEYGYVDNKSWFWPRHVETPLAVYSKSRVAQASRFWDLRKDEITSSLRGLGLADLAPGYALEPDPDSWDQVDLFVAASFWKQQERNGRRRARMSAGLGSPHEAALALMNRALQEGAAPERLLRLDDAAVLAALRWQQGFCSEGLLHAGSFQGRSLDSLAGDLRAGEIYFAEMTPREAFLAHGNGSSQLPGYLPDPDDMGVAPLPKSLWPADVNRAAGREGKRGAATRLWLWAMGRGQGGPEKTTDLLVHLSSTPSLVFEASQFGIIPARKEVLSELSLIFGGGWAGEIYQAAARQMIENGKALPPRVESFPEVARIWYEAANKICRPPDALASEKRWTWEEVEKSLREDLAPRLRRNILTGYPETPVSITERAAPKP